MDSLWGRSRFGKVLEPRRTKYACSERSFPYAGRLNRTCSGKHEVEIYDYADLEVPMLMRMFQRRSGGYKRLGYTMHECDDDFLGKSTPMRTGNGRSFVG
jgi:hypothetical protein